MAFIDLFIKSEENQSKVQEVKNTTVSNAPKYASGISRQESDNSVAQPTADIQPVVMQSSSKSISADENIVNMIWDKIIEANRPGPDYLELKNNVEALEDLPISNEQKLVSAFKVLKKSYPNFQKDDITKAIDFYINVVNDEKSAGLKQLETLRANNVDGAEIEIKNMQAKAEELKRQYDELQSNIGAKTLELAQAKNDIEMKYKAFMSSVDAVMGVLNSDKENVMSINF